MTAAAGARPRPTDASAGKRQAPDIAIVDVRQNCAGDRRAHTSTTSDLCVLPR